MKLRHFYRIDPNTKQPIPGSNLKRKSSPGRYWKEILDICCDPQDIPCTCGPRYFVQIDAQKKPVPGSLIKRFNWPVMEQGIRYVELRWKPFCCDNITWFFVINSPDTGNMTIEVNGNEVVNTSISGSNGTIKPNPGDTIAVTVTNDSENDPDNFLRYLENGNVIVQDTTTPVANITFVWSGKQGDIYGESNGAIGGE